MDLEANRLWHVERPLITGESQQMHARCAVDGDRWPCEIIRLLDRVARLEACLKEHGIEDMHEL